MVVTRALVAFLIALSVALLPATLGAGRVMASTEMSVSTAMNDCCPKPESPCDKTISDCAFMAVCALKGFNFAAQDFSRLALPLVQTTALTFNVSDVIVSHTGSPPLHPPQA